MQNTNLDAKLIFSINIGFKFVQMFSSVDFLKKINKIK